jgi:hypothetical protein
MINYGVSLAKSKSKVMPADRNRLTQKVYIAYRVSETFKEI